MKHRIPLLLLPLFLMVLTPAALARTAHLPQPAPDFTLPTASGNLSLHDLRGKVVLVDFWASWCAPCRASFPWMDNMLDRYAERGFAVVAVNLDKDRQAADDFMSRFPGQFRIVFDPAGTTAEAFHVQAMPSSFIVSRDGQIVYAHEGFEPAKATTVEEQIKEALSR